MRWPYAFLLPAALQVRDVAWAAASTSNGFISHDAYGSAREVKGEIILTPAAPHSQAGAIWAKKPLDLDDWTLTLKYRVNGPEHGGKGLAIWYTTDRGQGGPVLGAADKWDGLGLFLTAQPDGTGQLRGHLNDRSVAFSRLDDSKNSHFGVDHEALHQSDAEKQAFAACTVLYRNQGVLSEIVVSYNDRSLKVTHDGELCFESEHVALPKGHYVGVSALSAEQADSHELFGLAVKAGSHTPAPPQKQQSGSQSGRQFAHNPHGSSAQSGSEQASAGGGSAEAGRLTELLAKLGKDVADTRAQVEKLAHLQSSVEKLESSLARLESVVSHAGSGSGASGKDALAAASVNHELAGRLDDVVREVRGMEHKFATMEQHIERQTQRIVEALPPPAHDAIKVAVYVIVFAQLVVAGSYVLYRRRIDNKSKVW